MSLYWTQLHLHVLTCTKNTYYLFLCSCAFSRTLGGGGGGGGGGGKGGIKTHMQKSAVTSKSDGVKKTSCSKCVRGSVEYTKPHREKEIRGNRGEKRIIEN